jgi:hypothetical protein
LEKHNKIVIVQQVTGRGKERVGSVLKVVGRESRSRRGEGAYLADRRKEIDDV